jgi:hypothetical protein
MTAGRYDPKCPDAPHSHCGVLAFTTAIQHGLRQSMLCCSALNCMLAASMDLTAGPIKGQLNMSTMHWSTAAHTSHRKNENLNTQPMGSHCTGRSSHTQKQRLLPHEFTSKFIHRARCLRLLHWLQVLLLPQCRQQRGTAA